MRITVIAKNAGRRKELGKRPIELAKSPQTLQQLLEELTLMGLADAQAERTNLPLSMRRLKRGVYDLPRATPPTTTHPRNRSNVCNKHSTMACFACLPTVKNLPNGRHNWPCTKTASWFSFASPCLRAFVGEWFSRSFLCTSVQTTKTNAYGRN